MMDMFSLMEPIIGVNLVMELKKKISQNSLKYISKKRSKTSVALVTLSFSLDRTRSMDADTTDISSCSRRLKRKMSSQFIAEMEADQVISCANSSFVLSGTGYISNPAIKLWMKEMTEFEKPEITKKITKTEENCTKKGESIDDLIVKCKGQSQTIIHLIELCRALQQQSETFKNEIMSVCNENMMMMSEIHHELQIQKIVIQEMKAKNMNFMESNIIDDKDFI